MDLSVCHNVLKGKRPQRLGVELVQDSSVGPINWKW